MSNEDEIVWATVFVSRRHRFDQVAASIPVGIYAVVVDDGAPIVTDGRAAPRVYVWKDGREIGDSELEADADAWAVLAEVKILRGRQWEQRP